MMELIEYADRDMMMLTLAGVLSRDLRSALTRRERAVFCVPGGSTPGAVFDLLAAVDLEWDRVDLVLSDERWVPEDHPRSNTRQVRQHLMQDHAAQAQLLPVWQADLTPEAAAEVLSTRIAPLLPLDVALLGMGGDGHVASLFPGAPRLDAALAEDAPPAMALTPPGQPEQRLTLTLPVLRGAFSLHLAITGPEKREALDRAEDAEVLDSPVTALLDLVTVHWAP